MQIRGALRDEYTDKNDFPDDGIKRLLIRDVGNQRHNWLFTRRRLLLWFEKRIRYLSEGWKKEKSDLSKADVVLKHNQAILAAAEDVLNKVDWNKYR